MRIIKIIKEEKKKREPNEQKEKDAMEPSRHCLCRTVIHTDIHRYRPLQFPLASPHRPPSPPPSVSSVLFFPHFIFISTTVRHFEYITNFIQVIILFVFFSFFLFSSFSLFWPMEMMVKMGQHYAPAKKMLSRAENLYITTHRQTHAHLI